MMGGKWKDKKFVHKIIRQLLDGNKELFVVDDLKGSPTYTIDFARNVEEVIQTGYYGLYNMTCEGGPSRYEVAVEILRILELKDEIILNEVDSSYFSEEYFAPRPDSEVLENLKLKLRNLNQMRDWKLSLRDYLERDWIQIIKEKLDSD